MATCRDNLLLLPVEELMNTFAKIVYQILEVVSGCGEKRYQDDDDQ